MRKQPNYTCMLKNLLKLYCTWTWYTLWGFFVCVCAVLFYFMRPLWWDNYRTTSEAPSPGLEAETDTKLLRMKLHGIWTWRFFFILFSIFHIVLFYFIYIFFLSFTYFLFLFLSLFFLFFIFNLLSISLCLFSLLLISTLMLPVYIFETFFDSLLCFFLLVCLFVFPFFFNFFAFHLLSPFHSKYHHCYYYKLENT
jgi:hypothetical protein